VGSKKETALIILLAQPEAPGPAWWPQKETGGVKGPAEVTLDPRYPGSWSLGETFAEEYVMEESDEEQIEDLIHEWVDDYDEWTWEFFTQEVEVLTGSAEPGSRP